jgi:hypothetical protein
MARRRDSVRTERELEHIDMHLWKIANRLQAINVRAENGFGSKTDEYMTFVDPLAEVQAALRKVQELAREFYNDQLLAQQAEWDRH